VEQEHREEGVARSHHVVHVLPSGDHRIAAIVGAQLDRLATESEAGGGTRLLVLAPSDGTVALVARLANAGREHGPLLVPTSASPRDARRIALGASAVAATPDTARALVRGASLKLDAVQAVVLLELDALLSSARDATETVVAELPAGSARVATTSEVTAVVDAFLEGFARKARHVTYADAGVAGGRLQFVTCDRWSRPSVLRVILDFLDPPHATIIARGESAAEASRALASIGYRPDDPLVRVADRPADESSTVVWYDAPLGAGEMSDAAECAAEHVVALVRTDDLAEFLRLTGGAARPLALPTAVAAARSADEALRLLVRSALGEHGLHRELLALAPLFAEYDPAQVAAALARLVERQPTPRVGHAEGPPARESHPAPVARERPATRSVAHAPPGGTVRLFVSAGSRDGVTKGDLVGAIAGESGVTSDRIGRIDLRTSHAVVEVAADAAEAIIEAMTGKTIRGRVVNVRLDTREPEVGGHARGEKGRRERGRFEQGERPRGRPRDSFAKPARGGGRDQERPRRGRPRQEGLDGPRGFREDRGARPAREPRAIRESESWRGSERGDRLRHARRPQRED
jgi:ATP-dependent RNA helicase DeaD